MRYGIQTAQAELPNILFPLFPRFQLTMSNVLTTRAPSTYLPRYLLRVSQGPEQLLTPGITQRVFPAT